MDLLRKLDISGKPPTFLFFGKQKSETFVGGILTILLMLIGVTCLLLLGHDFLFRKNPNIVTSIETTPELTIVNENSTSFPVYFRLEDRDGAPINFTGIFYPYSVFWEYHRENESSLLLLNRTSIFPMEKCKETDKKYIKEDPSNFYCMKWNNESWGGSDEDVFSSFYSFFLSFCPTGFYDKSTCTPTDIIDDYVERKNMWYFSFFYPTYSIQPNNLKEPLKITYKNYLRRLSRNLVKCDKFEFQNVVLNDDQGILWNTYRNITKIALFEATSEYYYTDNHEDSLKPGQVAFIYQANFYFSSRFNYVTRSFQKLQDIAASIGGIIKCFMVVINLLSMQLNYNNIMDRIITNMFDWNKPMSDIVALKNKNLIGMSSSFDGNNANISKNQSQSLINCFLNNKSELRNSNPLDIRTNKASVKDIDLNLHGSIEAKTTNSLNKFSKKKIIFYNNFKSPTKVFKCLYHYCPFCLRRAKSNQNSLYFHYSFADAQARKRMDIQYYIKLLFDFTHMQKILLKEYQMIAIDYSKKPNIYQRKELGELYGMYTKEEEELRYKKEMHTLKGIKNKENIKDDKNMTILNIIKDINI